MVDIIYIYTYNIYIVYSIHEYLYHDISIKFSWINITIYGLWYHLVMTNIAMENPENKWRFVAGKIIYFYGSFSMAMLNSHRG